MSFDLNKDESIWSSNMEKGLPPPVELTPLPQTLTSSDLTMGSDLTMAVGIEPDTGHSHPMTNRHVFLHHHQAPPTGDFDSSSEICGGGSGSSGDEKAPTLKRLRLVWTPQLHKRFVDAVAHLGIKNAVPKTIMQLMSVDGLTLENVASHLQKYRLYLKRMQGLSAGGPGDQLFASSPVPAHFLHPQAGVGPVGGVRQSSEYYMGYAPPPSTAAAMAAMVAGVEPVCGVKQSSECSAMPIAEHPHAAPVEHSRAEPYDLKRPRLVWTPQLHKRFVDAVAHLGINNAVPKTIMQLMSVDGLTRENVADHLQKYRLYLKHTQGLSAGSGDPATDQLFASSPVPPAPPINFLHPQANVGPVCGVRQSSEYNMKWSATPIAEHPHAAPVEHSRAEPYDLNRPIIHPVEHPHAATVEPALTPEIHHPDTDPTSLENQGASSNGESFGKQQLDLEKQVEARGILLLFGEGYAFEKEMLIQLWMALGLLRDEPKEVIGAHFFEKLVDEGYILCSVANSLYKVHTEKLKTEMDIIRDKLNYIVWDNVSRNEYEDAFTETLHVSVSCDGVDETIFKKLGRFNRLRTLLFLGNYGSRLQQVPRDLFMRYESLLALDLSGTHIRELPSSTRKMIHLRYLDLSWIFIELLPERIDRFQVLQTLKLKGCSRLCRLPKEIKKLTELRHLDLDVLRQLTIFPKGMGALVNLRTLSAFPVGMEDGLQISELKYLVDLTGEFCIAKLENVQSVDEAREASLMAKKNIKKLELRWSRHQCQGPKNNDEAILENLRPYSDLEEIQILCYPGTWLPSWISDMSFHKLVSISLMKCENVAILPFLEKLPSLMSLELVGLSSVIEMNRGVEVDHVAFPKLQKLAMDGLLNLETWTEAQEGDYPSLIELSIKDCPKLPELPSLFCLPSLEHLEVSGCGKLAFLSDKQLSTSLQQLIVEDCPLIEERCSKQKGQDWCKIQHVPTIWIDQVAIQQEYEDDEDAPSEEDDESDW